MKVLYFHGLPGSTTELRLGPADWQAAQRDQPSFAQIALRLPPGPLHLVGFSLGAACALRVAALAPERVARVTLIAAAAPLELGDFLPRMAGAPVFRAARSHARLSALTRAQSVLARMSPSLFERLLTRDADPGDKALFADPCAGPVLRRSLQDGLGRNRAIYLREVAAYVQPWARHLADVRVPVALFHGTRDRWAPPDMADALAGALPDARLSWLEDAGHFTALQQALRRMI